MWQWPPSIRNRNEADVIVCGADGVLFQERELSLRNKWNNCLGLIQSITFDLLIDGRRVYTRATLIEMVNGCVANCHCLSLTIIIHFIYC